MKTFLKEVLLPLLIALCLAAFFKPVYMADGVCDYFLMWLCVGFPFGIRRMCLWLVLFGYGISGTVGIFALNIIIGAFEVPAHIVTPMEAEEQRRQQEEQAAKEARSQELAKAREEKRKAEKREFTARKKAGLLTPEEQAADEARLAHNRAWQKEWREKRKAAEPPKPPKPKSLKELAALQKAGADLTPEEAERLAAYRERKNRQHKAWYERQKAAQPPKPRTLKELAAAQVAGQPLTPEEAERLEASRSRKKNAYQELKAQAETDPAAAAELARRRAYHSEATKKSRQKMYEEAAAGNPAAQARYENFLAARRENYHRKKHDEKGEQIA